MRTNDLRDFYLKVWYGLVQDHKMSSEEADRLCDKYKQIIADGYENGEGPAKISDQLATQDNREAHEPGTKWSAEIRVAFNDENDPNDKWVKDYEGQSVWNFFDDLSDALPAREAIKCVPDRYKDAFRDYCLHYGMECPDESFNQGDTDMGKIHMTHNRREEDNVKDAKECKEALDKLIVGSYKLKGYGLETVLTEDARVGTEMPVARVELGIRADKSEEPYYKAGDLLEYYTFDFSGGTCHITSHLQEEDWGEMLSDHPSVTAMIEGLAPDMIDELENHDSVNRPGDEN